MRRRAEGTAHLVPIILRAVDWTLTPLGKLQALPKDARPVTSWAHRDEAFADIAAGVRQLLTSGRLETVRKASPELSTFRDWRFSAVDLGTLGGDITRARPAGIPFSSDGMFDLGSLGDGSSAEAINNSSVAVGRSWVGSAHHAVLFVAGEVIDLNDVTEMPAGLVLTDATGINDTLQIVAFGSLNQEVRSFKLCLRPS